MKSKTKMLGVALVAALGSGVVVAADGLYVGAGVMNNTASVKMADAAGVTIDAKSGDQNNLNAFTGYHASFGSFGLAGEIGYADGYGKTGTVNNSSGKLKNGGLEYSVLPSYKVSKDVEVYARYGVTRVDVKIETVGSDTADATVKGLGLDYALTKQIGVRAEYQVMDVRKVSMGGLTGTPKSSGYGVALKYAF